MHASSLQLGTVATTGRRASLPGTSGNPSAAAAATPCSPLPPQDSGGGGGRGSGGWVAWLPDSLAGVLGGATAVENQSGDGSGGGRSSGMRGKYGHRD